jgi:hypothetical protein
VDALRRLFVALLVASFGALSAIAITACGDDDNGEQVELSLTERDLSPARVHVKAGEIEFVVKNDGKRLHAFAVETPDGIERTKDIEPGKTGRVTVDLPDGKYKMYDPRGDYRALGVRGTVVVTSEDTDTDTVTEDTVTERTETERTVEENTVETPEPDQPPVTVTERRVQPAPRPRRPSPPTPPPVTQTVPVEPPPADNP